MDIGTIALRIGVAFLIGAALGLEREINEKTGEFENKPTAILGLRTFSLVGVFGAICGLLIYTVLPIAVALTCGFILLLLLFYYHEFKQTLSHGITTELALFYTFVIGLLLILNTIPVQLTLAISVGVILLLSQKSWIKRKVQTINQKELNAFISFAIIAVAILPFLPNQTYAIRDIPGSSQILKNTSSIFNEIAKLDVLNPFKLWLYVALITGVDLIGYILQGILGKNKGWLLASAAGGFVSSTATTQSLAQQSKKQSKTNLLVAAAILANVISFIQIAILLLPLNLVLFLKLLPIIITMIVAGVGILAYFLFNDEQYTTAQSSPSQHTSIINLKGALTFALLFLVINLFSKAALLLFGGSGFLVTTGIGSVIGLDAVMINTSQLVPGSISIPLAVLAFIVANTVNLGAKTFYSYTLGSKEFTQKFGISVAIIILSSLLSFLILS